MGQLHMSAWLRLQNLCQCTGEAPFKTVLAAYALPNTCCGKRQAKYSVCWVLAKEKRTNHVLTTEESKILQNVVIGIIMGS